VAYYVAFFAMGALVATELQSSNRLQTLASAGALSSVELNRVARDVSRGADQVMQKCPPPPPPIEIIKEIRREVYITASPTESTVTSSGLARLKRDIAWQTLMVDVGGVSRDRLGSTLDLDLVEVLKSVNEVQDEVTVPQSVALDGREGDRVITVIAGNVQLQAYVWSSLEAVAIEMHCGTDLDLVPFVSDLVAKLKVDPKPVRWRIFKRTPSPTYNTAVFAGNDMETEMLEGCNHYNRHRVGQLHSKYQNIQVWSTDNGEPSKPGLVPNHVLYLDGVAQSSLDDDVVYHEHLIHPGMLVHPSGPKRVAILGGGEGASLREVLKYATVEEAYMIELDDGVVNQSLEHLKQMNNCSYNAPGYKNCFEDPRTRLVVEDCVGWFKKRFHGDACRYKANESRFDVIIMDLLDPEYRPAGDFAKYLYSDEQIRDISCALNDDGVFVAQMGEGPTLMRPNENQEYGFKVEIVSRIAKYFTSYGTFLYTVYVPAYRGLWTFLVACKTAVCAERWHENEAFVNMVKRQRLLPSALHAVAFDGAMHHAIQMTPKPFEDIYCNLPKNVSGASCGWRHQRTVEDGNVAGVVEPHLALVSSTIDKNDPTNRSSAIVTRDIEHDTEIGLYDAATTVKLSRSQYLALKKFARQQSGPEYRQLVAWFERYGFACDGLEGGQYYSSLTSLITFVNHGCGDVVNVDGQMSDDDLDQDDTVRTGKTPEAEWDPVLMRRPRQHCVATRATDDIPKGAQMYEDYATFDFHDRVLGRVVRETSVWCKTATPSSTNRTVGHKKSAVSRKKHVGVTAVAK